MLTFADLKDRLMVLVSSAVDRFLRDRSVSQPRFAFVDVFNKKSGGPDPESFGKIYRDEQSRKEYLVSDLYVGPKPKAFYAVYSIKEVISRPVGETYLDEATFKETVILKDADIDVQNDIVSFFETKSSKNGTVFEDRRTRHLGEKTAKPLSPANTPA